MQEVNRIHQFMGIPGLKTLKNVYKISDVMVFKPKTTDLSQTDPN